jgi:diguanylate cyclase (GGDEF)-like protein
MVRLADPHPASTTAAYAISAAMVFYNVPLMFIRRLPRRWVDVFAAASVCLDFLACAGWLLLTSNDPTATSYVVFMVVAVEAGVLFRLKGTVAFVAALLPTMTLAFTVRALVFHLDFPIAQLVYRGTIVSLMAVLTGSISNASERRRGNAEEAAADASREADRFEAVFRVGQSVNASLRLDEVLEAAVNSLGAIFPERWHGIMLIDAEGDLRLASGHGEPRDLRIALPPNRPTGPFTSTLVFDDLWNDPHLQLAGVTPPETLRRYTSGVVTPLGVRDVHFGALVSLDPEAAAFGPEDVKLMEAIGPQLSTALENARLYEEVKSQSLTDPLTGLGNRRAFDQRLEQEVDRARRYGEPLSLALVDIDHFKIYNDTHGHTAGDDVLRRLGAALVERMIRRTDLAYRYGGEEFAIIMPGTGQEAASMALQRLHEAVEHEALPLMNHQPGGHLTISAGLTTFEGADTSAAAIVEQADLALYGAKQEGRNRTVVYESALTLSLTNWTQVLPGLIADKAFACVYQPIARLGGDVLLGYEALARPTGQPEMLSVEGMFTAAQRLGSLLDLDWLCYRAAIQDAAPLSAGTELFVNITLTTLLDPSREPESLTMVLQGTGREAKDIVLEINEREAVTDMERFKQSVARYRELGFRFAIDDVGEGHSTFEVLAAIEPEFIKVARSMVMAADQAGARGAIRGLVEFARTTGACVIAEGIEDEETATRMLQLGVEMGQGYHLGRPATLPDQPVPARSLSTRPWPKPHVVG